MSGKLDALAASLQEKRADMLALSAQGRAEVLALRSDVDRGVSSLSARVDNCEQEHQRQKQRNSAVAGGLAVVTLIWPWLVPLIRAELQAEVHRNPPPALRQ